MALTAASAFFICDYSLFGGCVLSWVCSNVFRANPACTGSAETAKGARSEAVRGRERELLVPCAGRVYREWGDGEGRVGLAVGGDENCVWVRTMPRRGGGADAAAFRTGGACGTAVSRRWLGGSRWPRARTRAGVCGLGTRIIDGVMVSGGRGFSWVVSEGGGKRGDATVVVWRCLAGGGRVGICISVVEGSGKWGELGRERELLRLLRLLLVRGVWRGDIEDVVAILLLVRLVVRRSFGWVRGVSRAFVRLVMMRMRVVLVLG